MKCTEMTWQETRLNILREQFVKAQRRLRWAEQHNRPWAELSEKGAIVAALEWAVEIAEDENLKMRASIRGK